MNTYPIVSPKVVKTGHFVDVWKSLDKTTRWTFLGKWNQQDESLYQEMKETQVDLEPKPFFARMNPEMKKISDDKAKARRAEKKKGRQFASYGKEK